MNSEQRLKILLPNYIDMSLSFVSDVHIMNVKKWLTSQKLANILKESYSTNITPVNMTYAYYEKLTIVDKPIEPLIVMHGLLGSKSNFASFCNNVSKKLLPHRKVITVDARNHGQSPHATEHSYEHLAQDLKLVMSTLYLTKASFLGHSMGGRAVMLFALKWPQLVHSLIVAESSPLNPFLEAKQALAIMQAMKNIRFDSEKSLIKARQYASKRLEFLVPNKWQRAFLMQNLIIADLSDRSFKWRINLDALIFNFQNIITFPDMDGFTYNGPTLFILGSKTTTLPKEKHESVKKLFPAAEFQYMDCGHILHAEFPTEFLRISMEFLSKTQKMNS